MRNILLFFILIFFTCICYYNYYHSEINFCLIFNLILKTAWQKAKGFVVAYSRDKTGRFSHQISGFASLYSEDQTLQLPPGHRIKVWEIPCGEVKTLGLNHRIVR